MEALAEINQEEQETENEEENNTKEDKSGKSGYALLAALSRPWNQLFGPDPRGNPR